MSTRSSPILVPPRLTRQQMMSGRPRFVTAVPTYGQHGDEIRLPAIPGDPTSPIWTFYYNSLITDAYKWVFLNGAALFAERNSSVTLGTLGAFTDYSDALPVITLPYMGNYSVSWGALLSHSANGQGVFIHPSATGLTPSTAAAAYLGQATAAAGIAATPARSRSFTGISGVLKHQYFVGAAGGTAEGRWTQAIPIRIGP